MPLSDLLAYISFFANIHREMFINNEKVLLLILFFFNWQLRERVATLEKQLEEERQNTEDLQFRIDEATICEGNDTVSRNSLTRITLKAKYAP